jgi:hypothetical protein
MSGHILRKEGKHYKHDDLEFWAEDGLIFIEDRRDGTFNVVPCREFSLRAKAINEEAKRATYPSDKANLNEWVLKMHDAWKEAKSQGDPADPRIALQKYRERRKVSIITGAW